MPELPIPAPNGFDSIIALVPESSRQYLPLGTQVTLLGETAAVVDQDKVEMGPEELLRASLLVRRLVREAIDAGSVPDRVRAAWCLVTTDREEVRRYGLLHDCAACRADVDQALAQLREHPAEPLLVGILAF